MNYNTNTYHRHGYRRHGGSCFNSLHLVKWMVNYFTCKLPSLTTVFNMDNGDAVYSHLYTYVKTVCLLKHINRSIYIVFARKEPHRWKIILRPSLRPCSTRITFILHSGGHSLLCDRVILVNGEIKCGRTHTITTLCMIAYTRCDFSLIHVDLTPETLFAELDRTGD